MDISARVNSLADKPRTGYRGHQGSYAPGRPILHRRLILSQTSAGNSCKSGYVTITSLLRSVPLFGCEPFLRSLIAATNASAFFLADLLSCFGPFFCSTAPQAFFRPDRRFPTPSRAEAVKAGRRSATAAHSVVSRPRLDSFEHGGRLDGLGPEERSVVECGPPIFRSRGLLSLPGPPFFTRSRVAGRTMASGVRRRYVPNALNKRLMHEESRGRRGPSQQGQRSAASAAKGYFDQPQATEDVVPTFHWNVAPVVHMRCRMTASLRATAIVAFLRPMRLPRASPQVFSAFGRDDRPSNTLAASNRSPRTMPSPHLEIRPA